MAAAFAFSPTFDGDNGNPKKRLKLLEADEALVAALEAGERVRFVGNSSTPDVVLCTARETFKVTKVESSNTTILCAGGAGGGAPVVARGLADFHWEARKTAPRLDLAALLPAYGAGAGALGGGEAEDEAAAPTRASLGASTQASAAELDAALEAGTVLVDEAGRHFFLDESKLRKCLDQVLTTVSLQGWPPSAVPLKACAEDAATHGSDAVVATHCLRHFSSPAATPGHVALDVRKIAKAVAVGLFAAKANYASTNDFLSDLRDCLPAPPGVRDGSTYPRRKARRQTRPHRRPTRSPPSPGSTASSPSRTTAPSPSSPRTRTREVPRDRSHAPREPAAARELGLISS